VPLNGAFRQSTFSLFHLHWKSGWDDGIAINPGTSQQQIVQGVNVNDLTCYLESQVPNLTPEFDFPYRACTFGVEAIDGCLSGA